MAPSSSGLASELSLAQSARLSPEQKLIASLISLLEAGTTPWRREWDASFGGHHRNLLSGRRYNGANPVLLALGMHLRGSVLPYWCGFAEAKASGLFPRKGSKAVYVLRPQHHQAVAQSASEPAEPGTGGGVSSEGCRTWITYRPVAVFNAADLEGPELERFLCRRRCADGLLQRSEPQRFAAAETVLAAWPVSLVHGLRQPCYDPVLDRISLPARADFHSAASYYATWAHEAIHSSGHPARLNRDLSGGFGSPAYAREELVAELGAVLLGDRLEIGSDTANHAAYLAGWIGLLRESPRLLLQVLGDARRAVDLICPEAPIQSPVELEAG